ncbi:MAG: glycerate kinase [Candidatus Acetothermia bacterium]
MTETIKIKNREAIRGSGPGDAKELALDLFETGISAALPGGAVERSLVLEDETLVCGSDKYDLDEIDRILVLGGGKASIEMAQKVGRILGDRISEGLIVGKSMKGKDNLKQIETLEGSHPLPGPQGVSATKKLLDKARTAGEKDLVICLISGGGSALLAAPAGGIGLESLKKLTELLLKSGASIEEINTVRKSVSRIKGGRLAKAIHPGRTLSLIVSDVVGDPPAYIASGPTAPVSSGKAEALDVLEKNDLLEETPKDVKAALRGEDGKGLDKPIFEEEFEKFQVINEIIASNETALSAMAEEARSRDLRTLILSTRLEGESRELGCQFGQLARSIHEEGRPVPRPGLLLSGGEATVRLSGKTGKGGPNQEFSLSAGLEIRGMKEAVVGALDSDGEDGSTEIAGGILDGSSIQQPEKTEKALSNHNSFRELKDLNGAVLTGPTGTNVNDLRLALLR